MQYRDSSGFHGTLSVVGPPTFVANKSGWERLVDLVKTIFGGGEPRSKPTSTTGCGSISISVSGSDNTVVVNSSPPK
jgi:hypothetical protein